MAGAGEGSALRPAAALLTAGFVGLAGGDWAGLLDGDEEGEAAPNILLKKPPKPLCGVGQYTPLCQQVLCAEEG